MWQQGQHVLLVGSTGSGKTTLAKELLKRRNYVIILVTKPDGMRFPGYKTVTTASKIRAEGASAKYVLKPKYERLWSEVNAVINKVWGEGCWTFYIDEMYFVQHMLKLDKEVIKLLTQGRSKFISVVLGVQRPSWVTRFAVSEPTHILCSRLHDKRDIKTMEECNGEEYAETLTTLKRYQFSYLDRASMNMSMVNRDTVLENMK